MSIVLNIAKPKFKADSLYWPKVSVFALYDGHGGCACADYLKEQLHQFVSGASHRGR